LDVWVFTLFSRGPEVPQSDSAEQDMFKRGLKLEARLFSSPFVATCWSSNTNTYWSIKNKYNCSSEKNYVACIPDSGLLVALSVPRSAFWLKSSLREYQGGQIEGAPKNVKNGAWEKG
jgi:hypothetical protein